MAKRETHNTIIIGGGAAGFFAALSSNTPTLLLEKTAKLLSKVRISGGGRCNVTHHCFEPKELVKNYPRGSRELLGPFHTFGPTETIKWFESHGVELKTEKDGRMFPTTDSSETIIECLTTEAKNQGVEIRTRQRIECIEKVDGGFLIDDHLFCKRLILATGSSKQGFEWAKQFGHTIQPTVPSLFTFNVPDFPLIDLSGVSVTPAKLKIEGTKFTQEGPLLITHWGFSGPCALKLSAFAARTLAEKEYDVTLSVDWLPQYTEEELFSSDIAPLPKKLWKKLLEGSNTKSHAGKRKLIQKLKNDRYHVKGKTTNKEEFVTCGGVTLSEVNFKTMESKKTKNLYFCGEILDIDGITGGFNFQNAWTTGYIAGHLGNS